MKKKLVLAACSILLLCFSVASAAAATIKMSTTTSTRDTGLLEYLLPEFKKDTGIEVQYVAKGTGAAIRDGIDGNVDIIFVHDTQREEAFVAEGWGTKRFAVMHNDFVLVGHPKDPAGIKGKQSTSEALKAIAGKGTIFVSRGDDSGTHARELALWKATGIEPSGSWYRSVGQGMGRTLFMAEEMQGYTLSDRGTFIQQKFGKTPPTELEIMVEGDQGLLNPYGVIPVNPAKFPNTKIAEATAFAEWLISQRGQELIARYLLEGQQLFFPDAIPDAK
jgi:tungstate transport system substrate-binding protein